MFELVQLEQLLAISKYETLSKASEELLISQPALSRSMQRLEYELQVPLFDRQKNKITFNENGKVALDYAKRILDSCSEMINYLQTLEKSRHTISIGSCAPAPMWNLADKISKKFPNQTIQSEIKPVEDLIKGLLNDKYQAIITNKKLDIPNVKYREYCHEQLYITLPSTHPLSNKKTVSFDDINGQSLLILSNIGFWFDICKENMPDSMFLEQKELSALNELRKSSNLPSFATNLTSHMYDDKDRVLIPFSNKEVNITFYLLYKEENEKAVIE